jgi:hypothetical protein
MVSGNDEQKSEAKTSIVERITQHSLHAHCMEAVLFCFEAAL